MRGSIARSLTNRPGISRLTRGSVCGNALGAHSKAFFGALYHYPCRTDLGLPDGARRLDVEDDRGLQVDKVVCTENLIRVADVMESPRLAE
jgi:hypothetical protein